MEFTARGNQRDGSWSVEGNRLCMKNKGAAPTWFKITENGFLNEEIGIEYRLWRKVEMENGN